MSKRRNLKTWLVMTVFLLGMLSTTFAGQIIYVDTDAPGPVGDGSSWTDAYVFLQHALWDASAGDEIRVAQGAYKPDEGILAIPEIDWRAVTFQLINNVVIKGGYAGYGQPDPNARDIEAYKAILSGDRNGDDNQVSDPCELPNDPNRAENSYHVVTGSGTDANGVLDGFTITAGNADCSDSNSQGGGLYNEGGSPTVINCTFSGNVADDGGGMCNSNNSNPTLSNCIIVGNFAFDGGGICCGENSGQTLNNCTITANSGFKGGGIFGGPGSNSTMTNCVLWNNTADYGPQMYLFGGLLVATYSDIQGGYAGTGNINADPCFVGTDDPHLLPISPCINAGDPSGDYSGQTDIDGEPRVRYSRVDIGADEVFPIAGDFEPDEDVDFADFAIFANNWLAGIE